MSQKTAARCIAEVLVADDHAVTRFGLVGFLKEKLGAGRTHEAARYGDALQILHNQPVDLAIFDLGIPGLTSAAQLAEVRESWPGTKVVVLSGSDSPEDILAALGAGVHGYIIKTETMDGLSERLAYVLSGEVYVPACLAERSRTPAEHPAVAPVAAMDGPKLTPRQRDVLRAIVHGRSNKQIAKDLGLAIGTVKMHVSAVLTALGAQNRLHAATLGRHLFD